MWPGARNKLGEVLYWREYLWYCWDFTATSSDSSTGALCPPCGLRYAPGVTLCDKLRSCEIGRALNLEPLLRIEGPQLHFFVDLSRIPREGLARQVLLAKPTAKRSRGHPRPRWSDYISDLACSRVGVATGGLSEITLDREVFQVFLGLLVGRNGCTSHSWEIMKLSHCYTLRFLTSSSSLWVYQTKD